MLQPAIKPRANYPAFGADRKPFSRGVYEDIEYAFVEIAIALTDRGSGGQHNFDVNIETGK